MSWFHLLLLLLLPRYDAGDHVAVYPTNDCQLVAALGEMLSIDMDQVASSSYPACPELVIFRQQFFNLLLQVFTMTNVDEDSTKKHPFPCPTTYRTAMAHYVEITALPRLPKIAVLDLCYLIKHQRSRKLALHSYDVGWVQS